MLKEELIYKNIVPDKLPFWGYKIHISATIKNYSRIFSIVEPILDNFNIGYKYLRNYEAIWNNFSVNETIAESGKFFTIYPSNREELLEVLESLHSALINEDGIYIMSDRPYKNSKTVFYRYGVIKFDSNQTEDGIPTLYGPGNEKWQDYQKKYFDLPSWIEDIQSKEELKESKLAEKYTVDKIISENNGGSVYKGQNKSNQNGVILKEVRPNILFFENIEKIDLRENEFILANKLKKYTPLAIEKVNEWINTYYIYEEIQGKKLYDFLRDYSIFNYTTKSSYDKSENIFKFSKFISIIKKIIDMAKYIHKNDIVMNDIHPDNFIVDFDEHVFFIDLEHSHFYSEKAMTGIYHDVALKEWNSLDGKIADCHKLGNMILFMIAKLQVESNDFSKKNLLPTLLENVGIKTNILELINYLLSPNASIYEASKIIDQIYISKAEIAYKLDFSKYEKTNHCINFADFVISNHTLFSKELDIRYQIESFKTYGVDGLAGKLYTNYTAGVISDNELEYGLERIFEKLIYTKVGRMIPIANNGSPYLDSGNAGLALILILLDPIKYKDRIIELADTLQFEFAQRPGYFDGMLGIATVLLSVYSNIYKKKEYLYYAEKLLLNCSFYVEYELVEKTHFLQVFSQYMEILNEITN